MPEALKKAYRRAVRNPNGIGLRIAYFDINTGQELFDLTGYEVIDQGTGAPTGTPPVETPETPSGVGYSGGGGDGGSSSSSASGWEEWANDPNRSRGSGNILDDLKTAFDNVQKKIHGETAVKPNLSTKDIGTTTPNDANKSPADREYGGVLGNDLGNYDFSQSPSEWNMGIEPNIQNPSVWNEQQKGSNEQVTLSPQSLLNFIGTTFYNAASPAVNDFIGDGDPAGIKQRIASTIQNTPTEVLINLLEKVDPEAAGKAKFAAGMPLIGEGLVKNGILDQIKQIPDAQIAQGVQQYKQATTVAPTPATKSAAMQEKTGPVPLDSTKPLGNTRNDATASLPQPNTAVVNAPASPDTASPVAPPSIPNDDSGKTNALVEQNKNAPNVKNATDVASQGGSPLDIAQAWLGYDERDPTQAQALSEFFAKAGDGNVIDPATTAWCAAWLNGVFAEAGIEGSGALNAKSFLNVGEEVTDPAIGDIVVFDRGGWKGHVGIVAGVNEDGSLQVIGGNQSDKSSGARGVSVNVGTFTLDKVVGFRRITQDFVASQTGNKIDTATADQRIAETNAANPRLSNIMDKMNGKNTSAAIVPDNNVVPQRSLNNPITDKVSDKNPAAPTMVDDIMSATGNFVQPAVDGMTKLFGDVMSGMPKSVPQDINSFEPKSTLQSNIPISSKLAQPSNKNESHQEMTGPYSLNDPERQRVVVQTVLGEAAGEGVEGMLAVANVIKNRALSGEYPPDPRDVALQERQFSAWNSTTEGGNNPDTRFPVGSEEYNTALKLVQGVFNGNMPDNTFGALQFHGSGMTPYWADEANQKGELKIGNHTFYPQKDPNTAFVNSVANKVGEGVFAPSKIDRPNSVSATANDKNSLAANTAAQSAAYQSSSGFMGDAKTDNTSTYVEKSSDKAANSPTSYSSSGGGGSSDGGSSTYVEGSSYNPTGNTSKPSSDKNTSSSSSSSSSGFMSGPTSTASTSNTSKSTSSSGNSSSSSSISNTSKSSSDKN